MDTCGLVKPVWAFLLTSLISIYPNIAGDEVRLEGGHHKCEGRVEVVYNQAWGTVCDDHWGLNEAMVVCKQLGYSGADQALVAAPYGRGSGPIWLDDVFCIGSEEDLFECAHNPIGTHNCPHDDDASVVCTDQGSLRLLIDRSPNEGVIEILSGVNATDWKRVCGNNWTDEAGAVACRQLGFSGYLSSSSSSRNNMHSVISGHGENDMDPVLPMTAFLNDFRCRGDEKRLEDCEGARWTEEDTCSGEHDVFLTCDPAVARLVVDGSPSYEGTVEVFYGGTWGTVCDDFWDIVDAGVVCKEIGYEIGAIGAPRNSYFGYGSGPILLDNLECSGQEKSIFDCRHSGFANDNCNHFTDAGAVCLPTERQFNLLLGWSNAEGAVEIYLDGEWGILCDEYWSMSEAMVVCTQLGYEGADSLADWVSIAQVVDPAINRHYECSGTEDKLTDCPLTNRFSYCYNNAVARVACLGAKEFDIRIADGLYSEQGRVEIYQQGAWGTINSLGANEAQVVCQQLGYEEVIDVFDDAFFGSGSGTIWDMDAISCDGDEITLKDCNVVNDGNGGSFDHRQDIGILCKPSDSIGMVQIRLVSIDDLLYTSRGRLEVWHDGQWGSVCASQPWGFSEIRVACQQLGYLESAAAILAPSEMNVGVGTIWLSDVSCSSATVPNLGHCHHSAWGIGHDCTHLQDVGLDCMRVDTGDEDGSPGIPVWEIILITTMGVMVVVIMSILAIYKRRFRHPGHSSNGATTVSFRARSPDGVEFTDNPMFSTSPPPEYRPPTPPPLEAPPTYDSVLEPKVEATPYEADGKRYGSSEVEEINDDVNRSSNSTNERGVAPRTPVFIQKTHSVDL